MKNSPKLSSMEENSSLPGNNRTKHQPCDIYGTLPHWFVEQDSSKEALGGFNCTGLAWRYIIPEVLQKLVHINILEFLAVMLTAWLTILQLGFVNENGINFLSQTDNRSSLGWMKGSTRYDKLNK